MTNDEQLRNERLQLLLQQLQIPDDVIQSYFQHGKIRKLSINKEQKAWYFQIELPTIVPASIYELFNERLQQSFHHIATVSFRFYYGEAELSDVDWVGYWPFIITRLEGISSGIIELLTKQKPEYDGKRLSIEVRNETEAVALKRKLHEPFAKSLHDLSLPSVQLDAVIKESKQAFEKFVEQREQEDHSKVVEAMLEKKKLEQQAEKKERQSGTDSRLSD